MLKLFLVALLPLAILFGIGLNGSLTAPDRKVKEGNTGTFEKMIAASGSVAIDLDLNRLNGTRRSKTSKTTELRFGVDTESFFSITPIAKSGAGSVRHMVFHKPTRTIWFGTDANTIGRAMVP